MIMRERKAFTIAACTKLNSYPNLEASMDIVWSVVVDNRPPYGHVSMFGLGEWMTVNFEPGSIFNSLIQSFRINPRHLHGPLGDVLGFTTPLNVYDRLIRTIKAYSVNLSRNMRFPTMRCVRPAKAQTSLCIRAV